MGLLVIVMCMVKVLYFDIHHQQPAAAGIWQWDVNDLKIILVFLRNLGHFA
jgi:hypothetical protein